LDLDILRRRLQHLGLPRTLAAYVGRALYRLAGVTIYSVVCLEPARVDTSRVDPRDLEVRLLEPGQLREAARDPGLALPPGRLAEELAKGDRCYGAFVRGALACYTFVSEGPTVVQGDVVVRFGADWALTRWTFTHPDHRGRALYSAAKAEALADEVRRGRRGLLGMVAIYNFESRHAAARLGFRHVGTMLVGQCGRRSLTWCSAGCRPYRLALVTGGRARALGRAA